MEVTANGGIISITERDGAVDLEAIVFNINGENITLLDFMKGVVVQERLDVLGEVLDLVNDSDGCMDFLRMRIRAKRYSALAALQAPETT